MPSTRTAAVATARYNVRDYQNPDAGAADQPRTKAVKGKVLDKKSDFATQVRQARCCRCCPCCATRASSS